MTLIPHRIPFILPKIFPSLLWRMPVTEKFIYLTFDDGPVPGPTEFVLDLLQSFQVKATFFCIGDNVQKHPEVFQEIIKKGHAIGNHTFNHLKGCSTSVKEYVENIKQCDAQLSMVNGQLPILFRPPYGRITHRQIKALSDYRIVMWDVLSHDYQQGGRNEDYLKGTIKATRPGSIVVFHDSIKAEEKLKYILPKYLEHFLHLGYRFKIL